MATLDEVYRARRGARNEQAENFLTACTGVLLEDQRAARAFLSLFGKSVPEGAMVKTACQVPVYDLATGESVGIADLVLSWREGDTKKSVVVEAKVDDPLTEKQPRRYADALSDTAEVVVLTPSKTDQEVWAPHASWQAWSDALAEIPGVFARQIRTHLDRLSLAAEQRLSVATVREHRGDSGLVDRLNQDARQWVRRLVPSGVVRKAIPSVTDDDEWNTEDPAGAWFEWINKQRKALGVPYVGLGVRFDVEGDDLGIVVSVLPSSKALRNEWLRSTEVAWMPEPRSEWLEAWVGVAKPEDGSVAEATLEMLHRARRLLGASHAGAAADKPGLWKRVRRPTKTGMKDEAGVSELVGALTRLRASQRTAELLKGAWIDAAHRAVEAMEVPVRAVYRPSLSFYVEDDRGTAIAQLSVNIRLHKKRVARAWVWFRRSARAEAFAERIDMSGWAAKSKVYKGDQRIVYCWPSVADDARLGRDDAEEWGRLVGVSLVETLCE